MAPEFEFSHEFKNRPVDQVRGKIIEWLNAEGAKKIKEDGAGGIEAVHGKLMTMKASDRNAQKKLRFTFTPMERGTTVKATVLPTTNTADGVGHTMRETRINWGLLMEDCWASVDGTIATKTREMLAAEAEVAEQQRPRRSRKEVGKFLIKIALVDVVFWTMMVLLFVLVIEIDIPPIILALPFLGASGLIVYGYMLVRALEPQPVM